VDEPGEDDEKRHRLQRLREQFEGDGNGDLWTALEWVKSRFEISEDLFHELFEGARTDIGSVRIDTVEQLYTYCYRVAGTVGLMTLRIMGTAHDLSVQYSRSMGRAFQLTNILRDVGEDVKRGRCYVPRDILERHAAELPDPGQPVSSEFQKALEELAIRARINFQRSLSLISKVTRDCRWALSMMATAYSWYLDRIERRGFPVWDPPSLPGTVVPYLLYRSWSASRGRPERCLMLS
jgi:phytoene synthase